MNLQTQHNLSELISMAESAVENVKDPELRKIAFSKTLDVLLNNSTKPPKTDGGDLGKRDSKSGSISKKTENKKSGPSAWITELVDEGFFETGRPSSDILNELANRSHILKPSDITLPLQKLCHTKSLRRKQQKSQGNNKMVFHWYNW